MDTKFFLSRNRPLVDYIVRFFTSEVTCPELHQHIRESCVGNPHAKALNNTNHDLCLQIGELSVSDFIRYFFQDEFSPRGDGSGLPTALVHMTLDVLCKCAILSQQRDMFVGNDATYSLNKGVTKFLQDRNAIDNLFYGFSFIAEKYKKSIFKIVIKEFTGLGTGFLVRHSCSEVSYTLVITNQHVAKYKIEVLDDDETELRHRKVYLSKNSDLAAILLEADLDRPSFYFSPETEVLDEVIVIGYPKIPLARSPYQVVHRGEVNAFIHDLWNTQHLLYSALTNPGNSGGPVLNKMGLVVGVATQQIRMQEDATIQPYYSAVTAADVIQFLNEEVLHDLNALAQCVIQRE